MITLKELQEKATALGIEYKSKATKADLEALIAEKEGNAPENVESNRNDQEGAKNEATQTLEENEQNDEQNPKEDKPKTNKDGFVAGEELTPKQLAEYRAKQKTKAQK